MDCDDHDACTTDSCDEEARTCKNVASRDADRDHYIDEACGGDDCDDNNANVFPGQLESCNRIDDDCDGLVDEDLWDVTQTPVKVSVDGVRSMAGLSGAYVFLSLAVDDTTGAAVVSWVDPNVKARVVTPALSFPGEVVAVATASGGTQPVGSAACDGRLLVTWGGGGGASVRTMAVDGTAGEVVNIDPSSSGNGPGVVRTLDDLVMTWVDGSQVVWVRRFDPATLATRSQKVHVAQGGCNSEIVNPAWNGETIAVASATNGLCNNSVRGFKANLAQQFAAVTGFGVCPMAIIPWSSGFIALATYSDPPHVSMQHVAGDGTLGTHVELGVMISQRNGVAAGPPGEFAVAFISGSSVMLARFDGLGTMVGAPVALNTASGSVPGDVPVVAYGAGRYWVAWADSRDGAAQVHVNHAHCAY
jgi:hypothetical protein